jgi:uncharacterized protein GlcG (DUF336 family)
MKHMKSYASGAILALALSNTAWAQQQDLEVTMDVVPANALPDAVTREIKLPDTAVDRAREAAAFGLETANKARQLGREFGREVSQTARDRPQPPTPIVPSKK